MMTKKHEKYLSQLKQKKYRSHFKEFLVEGLRLCEDLLCSDYEIEEFLYSSDLVKKQRGKKLLEKIKKKEIDSQEISTLILEKICTTKTTCPIIARVRQKQHDLSLNTLQTKKRFVVLENVADPGNIGTIIRTAEAFSWDALILMDQSVELYNPKLVRATMGSIFRFPIFCTNLSTTMSFFEYSGVSYIVTSVENGMEAQNVKIPEKIALFLGSEAHGVSSFVEKQAHYKVNIPTRNVESLNIAVAGGILLFLYKPLENIS